MSSRMSPMTSLSPAAATSTGTSTYTNQAVSQLQQQTRSRPPIPPSHARQTRTNHFYRRECLCSKASSILSSYTCPSCNAPLALSSSSSSSSSAPPAILTTYTSEGGTEQNLDITPTLKEEAYLDTNPHARPARALHLLAAEGDVHGAVDLLHSLSDEGEAEALPELVRYQDPLEGAKSALHVAVEAGREDMVWLLLWLSSELPDGRFPDESRALAEAIGLGRLGGGDIRALRDERGVTAEGAAKEVEGMRSLVEAGVLAPPS